MRLFQDDDDDDNQTGSRITRRHRRTRRRNRDRKSRDNRGPSRLHRRRRLHLRRPRPTEPFKADSGGVSGGSDRSAGVVIMTPDMTSSKRRPVILVDGAGRARVVFISDVIAQPEVVSSDPHMGAIHPLVTLTSSPRQQHIYYKVSSSSASQPTKPVRVVTGTGSSIIGGRHVEDAGSGLFRLVRVTGPRVIELVHESLETGNDVITSSSSRKKNYDVIEPIGRRTDDVISSPVNRLNIDDDLPRRRASYHGETSRHDLPINADLHQHYGETSSLIGEMSSDRPLPDRALGIFDTGVQYYQHNSNAEQDSGDLNDFYPSAPHPPFLPGHPTIDNFVSPQQPYFHQY